MYKEFSLLKIILKNVQNLIKHNGIFAFVDTPQSRAKVISALSTRSQTENVSLEKRIVSADSFVKGTSWFT